MKTQRRFAPTSGHITPESVARLIGIRKLSVEEVKTAPSHNTAYTLRAYALALRDIDPFGRNVAYAGNVRRNSNNKGNF